MTGPSLDSTALGFLPADPMPRRHASRAWAALHLLACAWLGAAVLACGGGGGSEGGSSDDGGGGGDPPLATEPVDLPPGQTVAELAWDASDGFVTGYLVFVSRNHGSFDFNQNASSPSVEIPGVPGDEIRITVVAMGQEGDLSEASPPSVEIRFHAAASAAVGRAAVARAANDPAPAVAIGAGLVESVDGGAVTPGDSTPTSDSDDVSDGVLADGSSDGAGDEATDPSLGEVLLTRAVRDRLLRADARLPLARPAVLAAQEGLAAQGALAGAADAGAAWLEAQVASEVMAGVSLVGTAEHVDGALRDLVWRDAFGQLFVSDGDAALEADETASTLVAAIRLGATERFVALADVDGDGLRDWITEDTTTGDAWLRSDDSAAIRVAHRPVAARLLGSGEFDGAGAQELLWQLADGSLALERPGGAGPVILAGALPPPGTALIAIADLNGDGRDDLVARAEDGHLALGQAVLDDQTGGLWIEWSEDETHADASVPFLGTLDLDLDGRAELAWLVGDAVEVRAVGGETMPQGFEF